jgi:hypothetical protein
MQGFGEETGHARVWGGDRPYKGLGRIYYVYIHVGLLGNLGDWLGNLGD